MFSQKKHEYFFISGVIVSIRVETKRNGQMYGSHTVMKKDCYGYERCVGMSLSYNFNTAKSKYKGTGAGNGEKSRL